MANRYWVGGAATWDGTAGSKWSTTSGGGGGSAVPTAADDVFLDAASGANNVTLSSSSVARSVNCTGFTGTITHPAAVTLTIGDGTAGASSIAIKLVAGMTYTLGDTSTSAISFVSTSGTQQTVDFGGKTTGAITFNGAGGSWILSSNVTIVQSATGVITLTAGSLHTNDKTITCGVISSSNTNTRSLSFGASSINVGNFQGTPWNFTTTTGLTFNAGNSTITSLSTVNTGHQLGSLTYYNWVFNSGGGSVFGDNTFNNLTITGTSASSRMALHGNQIVNGLFTASGGNAQDQRILVKGGNSNGGIELGTQRTITAASVSLTNADFGDILAAGAATWSGTSVGDVGNNTGITFTATTTRYWVGVTGGNWSSTANWSASSGGASGASMPLAHDTVIFDVNSITSSGRTITVNVPRLGKDVTFTGIVNNPTLAFSTTMGNQSATCCGNFTMGSGMTVSGNSTGLALWGRGSHTFTSAGATFTARVRFQGTGSYTLQDALICNHTSGVELEQGSLNTNSFNVTSFSFSSPRAITKALTLGTTTWTLTGTGTVWSITNTSLYTQSMASSTLAITDTSATSKTIQGAVTASGFVHGNLTITGSGSGAIIINQSVTFNNITVGPPKTLTINASITLTILGSLVVTGTSGNVITINSSSSTNHTISKASGYVSGDYLSISDSTASGGAYFAAGANSTDAGGGNSGWVFGAAAFTPTVADSVTMSHSATKSAGKAASDSVTLSETRISALAKLLAESITMSDSRSGALTEVSGSTITMSDAHAKALSKLLGDSLTLTDLLSGGLVVISGNTITVTDSKTLTITKLFNDSVNLNDSSHQNIPYVPYANIRIELKRRP